MASSGILIEAIANSLGLPRPKVFSAHRYLMMAGLITKSGRGTSAANMTALDASTILVAAVASPEIKDSAATVRHFAPDVQWLAVDIQRCIDGGSPAARYEYTLPHTGGAFFVAGFTGDVVAAVAKAMA